MCSSVSLAQGPELGASSSVSLTQGQELMYNSIMRDDVDLTQCNDTTTKEQKGRGKAKISFLNYLNQRHPAEEKGGFISIIKHFKETKENYTNKLSSRIALKRI